MDPGDPLLSTSEGGAEKELGEPAEHGKSAAAVAEDAADANGALLGLGASALPLGGLPVLADIGKEVAAGRRGFIDGAVSGIAVVADGARVDPGSWRLLAL